jgi:hypothetical protein
VNEVPWFLTPSSEFPSGVTFIQVSNGGGDPEPGGYWFPIFPTFVGDVSSNDGDGGFVGELTVMGIQGNPVSNATPSNGDVMQWVTGSPDQWTPTAPSGGVGQTIDLIFWNGTGWASPVEVPVFGVPASYSGSGIVSMGAQVTIGDGGYPSGWLQDGNGTPLPDGFSFSAFLFVESNYVYDIIAVNSFSSATQGGMLAWAADDQPLPTVLAAIPGQIALTTPSGSAGGISLTDNGSGGIHLAATHITMGENGVASGADSVALGDSGLAYSSDQTVVASTNATSLGVGAAQYSVIVAECQTEPSGESGFNTCLGPVILSLVDGDNAAVYNRTIHVHANVVARRIDTPGTDSAWEADGVLRGDGSSSYSWVGGTNPIFTVIAQDAAASSWTPSFGIANGTPCYLQASAAGDDISTINWEMTLTLDEVAG